jgi:hypothetical protein
MDESEGNDDVNDSAVAVAVAFALAVDLPMPRRARGNRTREKVGAVFLGASSKYYSLQRWGFKDMLEPSTTICQMIRRILISHLTL